MWIGAAEGIGAAGRRLYPDRAPISKEPPAAASPEPCRPDVGDQLRAGSSAASRFGPRPHGGRFVVHARADLRAGLAHPERRRRGRSAAPSSGRDEVETVRLRLAKQLAHTTRRSTDLICVGTGPPRTPSSVMGRATEKDSKSARPTDQRARSGTGTLIGLNVGLPPVSGRLPPRPSHYGPSWRRVLFVDLAAAPARSPVACSAACSTSTGVSKAQNPSDEARAIEAWSALGGAGLGAIAGVLGTRGYEGQDARRKNDGRSASKTIRW